jgi:glutaredoxin-related protein
MSEHSDHSDSEPVVKKPQLPVRNDSDDDIEFSGFEVVDNSYKGAGVLKYYYTTLNTDPINYNRSREVLLMLEIMEDTQSLQVLKIDLALHKFLRQKVVDTSNKEDLPQLFLDDKFIGTYDQICSWVENDLLFDEIKKAGYRERH